MKFRWLIFIVIIAPCTTLIVHWWQVKIPHLASSTRPAITGVFHLSTSEKANSPLTLQQLTRAAQHAGLEFVVLTSRNSVPASHTQRLHDVEVFSYPELTTPFGNVIQWGLKQPRSLTERQSIHIAQHLTDAGAQPIITHPTDPGSPWHGRWTGAGGIEIANVQSSLRRLGWPFYVGLLPYLSALSLNPDLAWGQIYAPDRRALQAWDQFLQPTVIGLCALNPPLTHFELPHLLRAWQLVLSMPPEKLSHHPQQRRQMIADAISNGQFHCSAALFGRTPDFSFVAIDNDNAHHAPTASLHASKVKALQIADVPSFAV